MNKRCLSFVLALVMILTMVPMTAVAASADRFTDVTKDKWYYTFVDYVTEKGYFSGTSETKFSPDVTMTRAMFVTALANLEGVTADNSKTAFTDVPAGKWYTGAAKWAVDNKILSGYSDGTFRPNAKITREEMCVIMSNYIAYHSEKNNVEHKKEGSTKAFPDASQISSWAKTAVADCRAYGLVDGFSDGNFRPKKESTRAEVAAVIYKLAWLVKEEEATSGGGGGGGGSRDIYGPYRLTVETSISATLNNTFTRDPNGAVGYEMDDKVIDVMRAFNEANKATYITAFNQAITAAKNRGALKADGTVKYVGVPVDAASTSTADVTEQFVSDIKTTLVSDTTLLADLAALPSIAGPTEAATCVADVIDSLVTGNGIDVDSMSDAAKAEHRVVIAELHDKIEDKTADNVRDFLNSNAAYRDYVDMIDNMNIDLDDTLTSYTQQLEDMYYALGGITPLALADDDVYYLKSKPGRLQTYIVVDPLEVMDQQYTARKNNVLARVQATADVNAWLACMDPTNPTNENRLFDGRKVRTAAQYYDIMVDQMEHMYKASKTWKPTDFYGDLNRETSIDGMVAAIRNRGGSMASNLTDERVNVTKAFFGTDAKRSNKGFDMTMQEFLTNVMHKSLNLKKAPSENDTNLGTTVFNFSFDPSDFTGAGTGSSAVEQALSWFNSAYPAATFTINATVDWERPL